MKVMLRLRDLLVKLFISGTAIIVMLAVAEGGLRLYYLNKPLTLGIIAPKDCPYIYGLNPRRGGISSQGLRDREFAIPKPKNTRRILLLGDSVTYGMSVPPESTFAKTLERNLNARFQQSVEVINTGVSAYTTYNEVEYYLARGREFQPDIVVISFCMNDVVDPVPHWSLQDEPNRLKNLPEAAIPDLDYHRNVVLPSIRWQTHLSFLKHTALYRFLGLENKLLNYKQAHADPKYVRVNGNLWPTYLVAENAVDIRVLVDYQSPEWRWLKSNLDRLNKAVTADGAVLVIMVFPLSYQLDDKYPFLPQEMFQRYSCETSIPTLDLLPCLRLHRDEIMFPAQWGDKDICHPTNAGHRWVAQELEHFLIDHQLVGADSTSAQSSNAAIRN
jgi:lysophospholipase L1-like esterase